MVTAELAACLPVLVLVLAAALTAVSAVSAQVRAQDAAREAARAAARGDAPAGRQMASTVAPGARVSVTTSGTVVVAVVSLAVRPLGGWLPSLTARARAVAALEPRGASP
jgi:TadE-like protein